MADISKLVNDIRREVNGCPEFAIEAAAIRALREFCQESYFYKKSELISLIEAEEFYDLTSSPDEVIQVDTAEYKGRPLPHIDPRTVPTIISYNNTSTTNFISSYFFEYPNTIAFYPVPVADETNCVAVRCILQPPENTTTVPDAIDRTYRQCVASGAIYYLCSQSNTEWYDPNKSMQKYKEFWYGITKAKAQSSVGNVVGSVSVRPRRFI